MRSAVPGGAPPGTVVHASLLEARDGPEGAQSRDGFAVVDGKDAGRDRGETAAPAMKRQEEDGSTGAINSVPAAIDTAMPLVEERTEPL